MTPIRTIIYSGERSYGINEKAVINCHACFEIIEEVMKKVLDRLEILESGSTKVLIRFEILAGALKKVLIRGEILGNVDRGNRRRANHLTAPQKVRGLLHKTRSGLNSKSVSGDRSFTSMTNGWENCEVGY
jgi:hypothetical protein